MSGGDGEVALSLVYAQVVFAVLLLSLDALLVQLVSDLDDWTIIFFRYAFMGLTILIYYSFQESGAIISKFFRIGWVGLCAAAIMAGAGVSFTLALLHTHTANVFLIAATTSLWASIFAYFLFGELVPVRTIVAIIVSFLAVGVVIGIELSSDLDNNWFGNVMAVLSSILTALYLVLVRGMNWGLPESEKIDFVPALLVAAFIESIVGLSAGANLNSVSDMDLLYLAIMGVIVLAVGSSILTIATKRISAPEVSLFMLLDSLLEPLWVYLAGFDDPPTYTLYAGAFVLTALIVNSVLALHEDEGRVSKGDGSTISGESNEEETTAGAETSKLLPQGAKRE